MLDVLRKSLMVSLLLVAGCGGGKAVTDTPVVPILITVSPASVVLAPGGTQSFTAMVNGASNPALTWNVIGGTAGGTILANGTYTAPLLPGVFAVRAALSTDANRYGEATVTVSSTSPTGSCSGADLGSNADLKGYRPFPSDNPWNQVVSTAPVDPNSAAILAFIGAGTGLKADFGSGTWQGAPIGISFVVVPGTQPKVRVAFTAYGDESDPGPMPVPASAPIEGSAASTGDRHVLVLDRDACLLYELYRAFPHADGSWDADAATIWDLQSNALRPLGWTSADAAGLPLFPGLARYDDVATGEITHALRFTVPTSRKAFVPPATHWASSNTSTSAPPMGMRVRLKAGVDISGYPGQARVVLAALKKYGMILADNGSAWYISGVPDSRWNNDQLQALNGIKGSDLEVIQMDGLVTTIPSGSGPVISSFSASASPVGIGQPVTLNWATTGATRCFVTPEPGLVRGSSVTLHPAATTLYTLTAQGPFGVATRQVTVVVN
ncbi:MAG: hypothetical protein IPN59_06460 [Holophaga sp.]|nr:hypothetical protein [Holophaga sp.]